jgi:cytosine/adenosine deaminase-related metal-dependent hydrolase
VGVAVGPAGVHSDGRATFDALREVALHHRLRRRTQANEQVDVVVAAERYGRRPLELLDDWGWLEPGVTIAHLCDVTAEEVARVAASGATATHAPGCDLPMGWAWRPPAPCSTPASSSAWAPAAAAPTTPATCWPTRASRCRPPR